MRNDTLKNKQYHFTSKSDEVNNFTSKQYHFKQYFIIYLK